MRSASSFFRRAASSSDASAGARVETVHHVVAFLRRVGGYAAAGAVVIGHHEPLGRAERSRTAGGTQRREPHMVEPLRGRAEIVTLLRVVQWQLVGRPHLAQAGRLDDLDTSELLLGRGLGGSPERTTPTPGPCSSRPPLPSQAGAIPALAGSSHTYGSRRLVVGVWANLRDPPSPARDRPGPSLRCTA